MDVNIVSRDGKTCRLNLTGEVTQRNLRKFEDPLDTKDRQQYGQRILCDMSATTLLDSAGVSWLLVNHKRCRDQGGRFVLHSIPQLIMNVILVLRLNLVFDIAEDEAAAQQLSNEAVDEPVRGTVSYNPDSIDDESDPTKAEDESG